MNASPDKLSDAKLFDLSGQVAIVTGTSRGLGNILRAPWPRPELIL
jgi:hypothetical protein